MRISVRISPKAKRLLKGLVDTGLYGRSLSEAAERLVCQALEAREIGEQGRIGFGGGENEHRRDLKGSGGKNP